MPKITRGMRRINLNCLPVSDHEGFWYEAGDALNGEVARLVLPYPGSFVADVKSIRAATEQQAVTENPDAFL